jgi:hypothetical protein
MWFNRSGSACLLLMCVLSRDASAQTKKPSAKATLRPETSTAQSKARLLAPDDGLSIISAALQARDHTSATPDCSHLVHAIYERAGFSYAYVNSSDLYAGVAEFRRVTRPQTGDLVAWPGHVGIVVSPPQKSFFSSLRTGLGVDEYDSTYWKSRGTPRFFRYARSDAPKPAENRQLTRTALKTTPTDQQQEDSNTETASPEDSEPTVSLPQTQAIESSRPAAQDVSNALSQALEQSTEALRAQNVFRLTRPLMIVSRLQVQKVKLKGDRGWADVRITQSVSLSNGEPNLKKRDEKQRLPMRRRDEDTWEIILPQQAFYIHQDSAVPILARQLAAMTEAAPSGNARQKAQLAQLLNRLLEVSDPQTQR